MNATIIPHRLHGKIAVVTASTDGIGYAIARRLAQEGATVIISSRKQKNVDLALERLKSENLNATGLVCHVSNREHRRKLFEEAEKFGGLDILISNAAINTNIDFVLNCDERSWDKIFDVNVKSSWLLVKEALPLLRKRPYGRIVFISSIAGFTPSESVGAYSVSKSALLGLTKAAAQQLAEENITVNCIAPGLVKTKFSGLISDNESVIREVSRIPMKRGALPYEIGSVAAFLASDDSSYITGENIVVAGGIISRL